MPMAVQNQRSVLLFGCWVRGRCSRLKDATIWSTPDPKPFQDVPFESDLVEVQIRDRRVKVWFGTGG